MRRLIAVCLLLIGALPTLADKNDATKPTSTGDKSSIDLQSLTDLEIVLSDDQGEPIVDAAVVVVAMRVKEGTGHGFWNENVLGPPKSVASDKDGRAVVKFPAKIDFPPQTLTTRKVTLAITHYDFVSQVVDVDIDPPMAEITMKRGCDIQLSAVNEKQDPVSGFAVMVAGPLAPEYWVDDENGGRRTGAASDGTWQTMLVKPQEDGVTLFSSVLPLRVRPEQAVRIRNIRLRTGARVQGRLSDNVPRPVKNGYLVTTTVPKPANVASSKSNPSLCWHETVAIPEDGSFELKSLPKGGKLQIIAMADGWLSKTVPDEKFHVRGQMFDVNEPTLDVVIQMEPTGTLEVSVTKPDGSPLVSGNMSSWPLQGIYKNEFESLLGSRLNSMQVITNQLLPIEQRSLVDVTSKDQLPFDGQPITDGKAVIKGLPIQRPNLIALDHPEFALIGGVARFNINSEATTQLSVKTKRIK